VTIPLHPVQLAAVYDCLRVFPPFNRWRLPVGDEVSFTVASHHAFYGWHNYDGASHTIAISQRTVGQLDTLMLFMAHEMIHLHQAERGTWSRRVNHNAEFRRLAARVCRVHGFDLKVFV